MKRMVWTEPAKADVRRLDKPTAMRIALTPDERARLHLLALAVRTGHPHWNSRKRKLLASTFIVGFDIGAAWVFGASLFGRIGGQTTVSFIVDDLVPRGQVEEVGYQRLHIQPTDVADLGMRHAGRGRGAGRRRFSTGILSAVFSLKDL